MKHCAVCGQDLPESEFYVYQQSSPRTGTRLSALCKVHHRERSRRYWKETYYPEHAEEHKARVVKSRASRATKGK